MKTSRYISFQGATENRRKHAFDISPPEFARINGFLNYEQTGALLTPVPAMTVTIRFMETHRVSTPGTWRTPTSIGVPSAPTPCSLEQTRRPAG